ncbi:DEAD/DEAH box helicase [Timonella senegalensis]|uniref:DEAD/DEAH box helicase n=1 Tax=Timonella senegalensis TaxID=1465825 RepID=UPI0028A91103|nr:DEAD/DEAH box helicase [Timonella senegalensis]
MSPKRSRVREQKRSLNRALASAPSDAGKNSELSPAEKYAQYKARTAHLTPALTDFREQFEFELDDFQLEACAALEDGHSVLVAAPTGAGKTIVGEFATHLALRSGMKAFYTTPIKALSNQKYSDLVRRYGASNVGLLTGDTSINSEAPVVVMTTEVLRNMLYADSRTLDTLGYVVMDEVHYLADRHRGAVWEEVIIHLDESVRLVSLSATVSNAEEFGDWLTAVRGDTKVVVSETRPVPLWQHVIVQGRGDNPGGILDLYAHTVDPTEPGLTPPINPDLLNVMRRGSDSFRGRHHKRGMQPASQHTGRRGPPRFAVIDELRRALLLPVIYFIFSRAGCDSAVAQCLATGISLTTEQEAEQIRQVAETRCADIPAEDLSVLGFWSWLEGLTRGIAAHHAGMLPLFKETVEDLFSRGLIKAVFATETLALGINMPARTVVLEKLVKWDGTSHVDITPGEYTQLTGRAGRRGIDVEGHAVVVDHPGLDPMALAGLASKRLYPLKSSFSPTYNMSVNLIEQRGRERAKEILESSFAQFQADRSVVSLARRAVSNREALAGYEEAMTCERGSFPEYMKLRRAITAREKELASAGKSQRRGELVSALSRLRRSQVLELPSGRSAGYVVVIDRGTDTGTEGPRPVVLTEGGKVRVLTLADLSSGFDVIGTIRIESSFNPRRPSERSALTSDLRHAVATGDGLTPLATKPYGGPKKKSNPHDDSVLRQLRKDLKNHPCHTCPDRDEHARWGDRWNTLERDQASLLSKINSRTGSISKTFERVCKVLLELGYLTVSPNGEYTITGAGRQLGRIYAENDLLVAQCLKAGLWDDLDPAQLAAAVSVVVYQSRRDDEPEPRMPGGPTGTLARAVDNTVREWSALTDLEDSHGIKETGDLDLGLVEAMHKWTRGRSLNSVLKDTELTAGDFVRWCKQILDALDQIANVTDSAKVRASALSAIDSIKRGVVAYSSV